MHFKNALNAFIYTVFRAFFTQSLAKFRLFEHEWQCRKQKNVKKSKIFILI